MQHMAHIPINHPLRPVYRVLSGLAGLYVLLFGIIGYARSSDLGFFDQHGVWVLGLRTNSAFSVLSIVAGAALLGAALVGRKLFPYVNFGAGFVFLIAGMAMMALLQTDANILAFSMINCIMSFIFGMLFLAAALYGKVGSTEEADAEEAFRRRGAQVSAHS
jgi:Domain of unknown function (DUF4383)